MSVAFRRETDDEHLEPRFEIPIAPGPNIVTRRGLAQIEGRLAELAAAIAAGGGEDLLGTLRRDQRYWGTRLATARLAPPPIGDAVAIGTRVRYRLNGVDRTAEIVGGDEADVALGRVAFSAPLARTMIGLSVGDRTDFAGTVDALEILAITAIEDDRRDG